MTLVEGFMRDTYLIGFISYFAYYNLCLIYGYLIAIWTGILGQDWYTDYHLSVAFCESYIQPLI